MYFYFDQMFRTAVGGIEATSVMPVILQIAGAILLASLLFSVYEAFSRGGDVRLLATSAIRVLILGLIFLNYGRIFLGVTTMFNQVAEYISTVGPGGMDVFETWCKDIAHQLEQPISFEGFFGLAVGSPTAVLGSILLFVGFVGYAIAYAIFCILYALYGSILYVAGPLILAIYPSLSSAALARTFLVNLIVFHSWGLVYAVMGCLMWAINMGSVAQVLTSGSAAGFFRGSTQILLLALVSILFAICIALIPFLARRIVQGDIGSSMFAVVGAAATAASITARSLSNLSRGAGRGPDDKDPPPPGDKSPGNGGEDSSGRPPRPPSD